ncbi:MAG: hypothetical protein HY689_03370 [Chloroflexi bacterium]|nr:hypothetical protein [Chloroflexota bacterium]
MSGDDHAPEHQGGQQRGYQGGQQRGYQGGQDETVDWEQVGRSIRRTSMLVRVFAVAVGATLGAQALTGFWNWLRRPPGA